MSKTVATCIAETNQAQNMPQENVFFLTLSRKLEDFPNEFLRTARSTSPIQICAIFSTIGPDNLAAVLNLELNNELEKIVAAASNQPVLDFEGFSNQVINTLNVRVCNFAANKGQQFKTSMTMLVIEGDILRVIHVGVTKAVLFRDQRIMLLTEEQTVAHRYVQLGSITAEQEKTHPENMNLTQYLGKMPQDGQVQADRKIHLKLKDGDELFLMGLGISRQMPPQMRNQIIAKPVSTENKAKEMIASAVNYGIKSGLTFVDLKVESTFLLPGDAVIGSNLNSDGRVAQQKAKSPEDAYTSFGGAAGAAAKGGEEENTISFVPGRGGDDDDFVPVVNEKKEKIMSVVIPAVIFLGCVVLGFGVMFLVFNMKNLIDLDQEETTQTITIGSVLYVINDNTPVYSQNDTNSTIIGYLNRGDVVTLSEETDETFKKVVTGDAKEGYIMSAALSTEDPTIYDETSSEMLEDPTPVPEETTTTAATEATTADPAQNTQATTAATEATTTTAETEPPEEDQTETTTTTSETSATSSETTATSESSSETTPAGGEGGNDENAGN
ncbi:MAG: SH3 domain-containing protein [Clostridiales bacterium]|nr:SH3 domain-containing protein [Clostridiales bacterium]